MSSKVVASAIKTKPAHKPDHLFFIALAGFIYPPTNPDHHPKNRNKTKKNKAKVSRLPGQSRPSPAGSDEKVFCSPDFFKVKTFSPEALTALPAFLDGWLSFFRFSFEKQCCCFLFSIETLSVEKRKCLSLRLIKFFEKRSGTWSLKNRNHVYKMGLTGIVIAWIIL